MCSRSLRRPLAAKRWLPNPGTTEIPSALSMPRSPLNNSLNPPRRRPASRQSALHHLPSSARLSACWAPNPTRHTSPPPKLSAPRSSSQARSMPSSQRIAESSSPMSAFATCIPRRPAGLPSPPPVCSRTWCSRSWRDAWTPKRQRRSLQPALATGAWPRPRGSRLAPHGAHLLATAHRHL